MSWVSLHTHSQYSVLDALASVDDLARRAADHSAPALALTDHGNLYGAVEFFLSCQKAGVKPIVGCEVYVAPDSRFEKKRRPGGGKTAYHLVLLAKNAAGYQNLCQLSSKGFIEGFYYNPRVDKELLKDHAEGLICLSACLSGEVAQLAAESDRSAVLEAVAFYQELYGDDYYLEVQRHAMMESAIEADGFLQESWLYQQYDRFVQRQAAVNDIVIEVAKECGVPLVATNDIHYLNREDWRAHEILLNVQSGEPCEIWEKDSRGNPTQKVPNPKRRTYSSHELYFKDPEQMAVLFEDLPEAISNTLDVAQKCNFELDLKTRHYPVFVPPNLERVECSEQTRQKASEQYLAQLCEDGIEHRYSSEALQKVAERYPGQEPLDVVRNRLQHELDVIVPKGMCDYLLIVWDFINWAKKQGIPVGPGRGSGAGSIILYLIGVTDIEPLRFGLFFERFINPERISYPDIDVDICMERRAEVISYTVGKYGADSVAQIITFGTMKAKMALKDVGRVLSVPLAKVNAIAKLVPEDPNMTLDRALEIDPDLLRLYEQEDETKRVIDLARRLEGCVRNTGIHAAGVIVSGEPLTAHIPICSAKDSEMAVTQYSMKPLEKAGMLKIDFLGLKTLTSIDKAIAAVKHNSGQAIDPLALPLDDVLTFALLNQGKTLGVFQMESGGMQDLARQLHLDRFEEIIAVGALYRPGPMEMIPAFIARKHGREAIEYDHPWMKDILSETYGIMVYQEQVMQIAQVLAGYSLGEGDVLRKAMGKKIMEEMAQQREKFRQGALDNEVDEETAMRVFGRVEQFAKYGFNKSHATSYGLLTYVTAYLKANYPREWMAALMTCDRHDTGKVARFIRECGAMQIAVLPPDVNEAGDSFVATESGIRFAMSGIRGVGQGVVETIVSEREEKGPFESLYNFVQRLDPKKVGKKVVETLVDAGCFDYTGWSRDQLRVSVGPMVDAAQAAHRDKAAGVMSLFSLIEGEEARFDTPPDVGETVSEASRLLREKELLGFFLTGHPMEYYRATVEQLSCIPLSKITQLEDGAVVRAAFIVDTIAVRIASRSQRKFAILTISDGLEGLELPIWPELYEEKGHLLAENQMLYAVLKVDRRDEGFRLNCKWIDDLTRADAAMIEKCDRVFDRAKQEDAFRARRKEAAKAAQPTAGWVICLDIDQLHLSHLLHLKEIFHRNPGRSEVRLSFRSSSQEVGTLAVDSKFYVDLTPELKQGVAEISSVLEAFLEPR